MATRAYSRKSNGQFAGSSGGTMVTYGKAGGFANAGHRARAAGSGGRRGGSFSGKSALAKGRPVSKRAPSSFQRTVPRQPRKGAGSLSPRQRKAVQIGAQVGVTLGAAAIVNGVGNRRSKAAFSKGLAAGQNANSITRIASQWGGAKYAGAAGQRRKILEMRNLATVLAAESGMTKPVAKFRD